MFRSQWLQANESAIQGYVFHKEYYQIPGIIRFVRWR